MVLRLLSEAITKTPERGLTTTSKRICLASALADLSLLPSRRMCLPLSRFSLALGAAHPRNAEKEGEVMKKTHPDKNCRVCNKIFTPSHPKRVHCSDRCDAEWTRAVSRLLCRGLQRPIASHAVIQEIKNPVYNPRKTSTVVPFMPDRIENTCSSCFWCRHARSYSTCHFSPPDRNGFGRTMPYLFCSRYTTSNCVKKEEK